MRDLLIPTPETRPIEDVAPGIHGLRTVMVNLYSVSNPDGSWVLIDTGLPFNTNRIREWVQRLHGPNARPVNILLTHGHFDHVGTVQDLAGEWNVPVYAHSNEMPYLTGRSQYPPPDPTVGGGLFSLTSIVYPRGPIDISSHIRMLPEDGTVPGLPGWRWIPTPGHSPGHVSFFRDDDRALIAGDAFVTTRQESLLAVATQRPVLHGPPAYFTPDWEAARQSVVRLAGLAPVVAATGHGLPIVGAEVPDQLDELANHFDDWAKPAHGRYVREPAVTNENGIVRLPPPVIDGVQKGIALAALGGLLIYTATRRRT